MNDRTDPATALHLELVNKARPGMSRIQAIANGARSKVSLAEIDGMTSERFDAWCAEHSGRSLIVLLDADGKPHRPKATALLVAHGEVDEVLARNPGAVVVASWGVWTQ